VLSPNQRVYKVVDDRAQSDVLVSGLLELDEPRVIAKASIAKPVNEVIGAAFLRNEGYGDTGLRRRRRRRERERAWSASRGGEDVTRRRRYSHRRLS
jgi:hypothetical protein